MAEAKAHVELLLRERSGLTAADYVHRDFDFEHPEDREDFREALVLAGLPA